MLTYRPNGAEFRWRIVSPRKRVLDSLLLPPYLYFSFVIRQKKEGARRKDGRSTIRIQREKPNALHAILVHISTHVQFMHRAKPGNSRQKGRESANVPHRKRGDCNP